MKIQLLKNGELFNTISANEEFAERYCIANGLTYTVISEPAPEPEPVLKEPTEDEDRDAMLVDLEYRVTLLELGVTE